MKPKLRILIVDDERDFVDGLSFFLSGEGFDVTTATSGHEMLEQIRAHVPDLLILDVMMPAYSGLEALTAIGGNPKTRDLPVILMSASPEPKAEQRRWCEFIRKPFDIDALLEAISKCIKAPAHTGT